MPTLIGTNLINRASTLLQDQTNVRWTRTELLDWLNDGQRVIVQLLPESFAVVSAVTASTNGQTQFAIPSDGIRLIDVLYNTAGQNTAVRQIDRSVLDTQYPTWRTSTPAAECRHFSFDKRTPKVFFLYPPLTSGSGVEIAYSASPTPLSAESSTITLDDVFATALVDFIVYRAYLKDAEYAANDRKSQGAYETFVGSLTGMKAANLSTEPDEAVVISGVRHSNAARG